MADVNDARLEQLLRTTLRAETADLPVVVQPGDVLRRRQERRVAARRRLPLRVLAVAAAVALPLAAIIGIGLSEQEVPTDQGAVIVRGLEKDEDTGEVSDLEVILVDHKGREHGLARYDAERFVFGRERPGQPSPQLLYPGYPKVSQDGWLAFDADRDGGADEYIILTDLTDPGRDPIILEGAGLTGFAPDGVLWRYVNGEYERIDPVTGRRRSQPDTGAGGFSPWHPGIWALAVAADGSGPVVEATSDATGIGMMRRSWGVKTLDEAGTIHEGLPEVAPGVGPRLLSREHGLLTVCDSAAYSGSYCPDLPAGSVVSGSAFDRPFHTWAAAPGPHEYVMAASWAADGGIWRVLDRRDDGRLLDIVHTSASGDERRVATFSADPEGSVGIAGLAPDDSWIALYWVDDSGWQTALVDTRTDVARRFVGQVAGWVPSQAAIDWLPGSFDPLPGELFPRTPPPGSVPYRTLLTIEAQMASAEPGAPVLFVHEGRASTQDPGTSTEVVLGPLHIEDGFGLSVVCSGPGVVTYAEISLPPSSPSTVRCQEFVWGAEAAPDWQGEITFKVTADAATDWRFIVFDPPPPQERRPSTVEG